MDIGDWRALRPGPFAACLLQAACCFPLCAAAAESASAVPASDALGELRAELAELRGDYAARLADLESRLAAAEQAARDVSSRVDQVAAFASSTAPSTAGVVNGREFNPAIGVILQGQVWHADDLENQVIPGFPAGGEAGPLPHGLSLGESEVDLSANVDDLFTAWLTLALAVDDGETEAEIEEAWVQTLALPAGVSARFGRFFSNIGYLNHQHAHAWDFMDQPLAYQAFLGSQYIDDGLQVRWLAPTDVYLEVGGEILRGDRYPAGGAANGGFGSHSLFARFGGDVGTGSAWQAGLSYLHSESDARSSGSDDAELLFSGDTDIVVAELLWKWAPQGNWRQRNFVFQSEALWRNEDGRYALPGGFAPPIDTDQFGWYAQAVYQFIPQWRVGARIEALDADAPSAAFAGTPLEVLGDDPRRLSLMVDWSHSEFSRVRLQYSRDESTLVNGDTWGLQYIHSIGAHGAHSF